MLRSSVWAPEQSFVLVPNNGGISPSYMVSVELVHPKMLTPQKLSSHSPAVNVKLWTNKELYPRRWFCWYSSLVAAQFTLVIARSTFRYFWEEVLPMMVSPRGFQSINFSLWARALPGWLTGPGTQCKNLQEICFQVTSYLLSPTSAAPSGGYKLVIYFPPILWSRFRSAHSDIWQARRMSKQRKFREKGSGEEFKSTHKQTNSLEGVFHHRYRPCVCGWLRILSIWFDKGFKLLPSAISIERGWRIGGWLFR